MAGRRICFENDRGRSQAANKSLRIKLVGTKSNRDGIGTVVKLTAGGETQTEMLRSGSSYLSASELVLTFGLARHDKRTPSRFCWPSGQVEQLTNVAAGQTIIVTEGKGITGSRKYGTVSGLCGGDIRRSTVVGFTLRAFVAQKAKTRSSGDNTFRAVDRTART